MNANGVLASLCFPSFPGFCGALWTRTKDKGVSLTMLRAYNDWHIDEWCGAYPGRFIPLALAPLWDPKLMADEIRRVAKKGCHAVTFSENPEKLGLPSLHSEHWDPFWSACCDEGTIVCIHIGSGPGSGPGASYTSTDAPIDVMITLAPGQHRRAARRICSGRACCATSRACASPCPRAASAGSRTCSSAPTTSTRATAPGPTRTSARAARATCSASRS